MMNDVIGSVRQVVEDFLAPELRQHRAELVSFRGELSAKIEAVERKIGAVESRLESKIDGVESRLDSKINVLENKISVLDRFLRIAVKKKILIFPGKVHLPSTVFAHDSHHAANLIVATSGELCLTKAAR